MGRCRRIIPGLILALGLTVYALSSWASFLTPGQPAPNFLVESGSNKKLSLNMIRGKVIVLFYEFRHSLGQNNALKDVLKQFYREQPADIKNDVFRLVVVDCSKSSWPTAPFWKSGLREHSQEEGFTIYGDWNRDMFKDYRIQAGESNFMIIDKHGIIRYSATGKVNPDQFKKIKELLLTLIKSK
jgi:peroxiredoxin